MISYLRSEFNKKENEVEQLTTLKLKSCNKMPPMESKEGGVLSSEGQQVGMIAFSLVGVFCFAMVVLILYKYVKIARQGGSNVGGSSGDGHKNDGGEKVDVESEMGTGTGA